MKIGFLITARLKSTRIKHKILLDLNGKPIIQRIIERCKATKDIEGIVLCTSINLEDSILYEYALKNNIEFYPGAEEDVLDRLLNAAEHFGYNAFLSITADNPLFSIYTSQIAVDWFKNGDFDFIFMKGLPIGVATYFLKTKALKVAHYMKKESDTEIWGPFVNRDDFFNIGELYIKNSPFGEEKRITCDYPEDYEFINKIYDYYSKSHIPRVQSYFQILRQNPELWKINEMHTQKALDKRTLEKINKTFNANITKGRKYAKSINLILKPSRKIKEIEI